MGLKLVTFEVPSGLQVTVRRPTVMDLWFVWRALPDLSAAGEGDASTELERFEGDLRLFLRVAVDPPFWADMRTTTDASDPVKVPEGRVEMHLSPADFGAVRLKLAELIGDAKDEGNP